MNCCSLATRVRKFLRDESGPTAVEYAVMLAMILMVAIASISVLGGGNDNLWSKNANGIDNAVNGS